ncbi:MAG: DUF2971 domain-containing protein [Paludibacteraceae bacterium]|nr:DUF2971 domain-containing protein [Paludibacteraceae bacterium]
MNRADNILNGLNEDSVIYKYFPMKYLKILLQDCLLRVGHTSKWEDVYENFFLKNEFVFKNLSGSGKRLIGCVYGQSWTLQGESDAMWRIYSNKYRESCAVRIKTTVGKLFSVIYPVDSKNPVHDTSTFIGRVNYLTDEELIQWQQRSIPASEMLRVMMESFFVKRKPFEHEQEVRIIRTIPGDFSDVGVEFLEFEINPHQLIDEFVIEPRLTDAQCEGVRSQLIELGVSPEKISQSDLYRFKPSRIVIQP